MDMMVTMTDIHPKMHSIEKYIMANTFLGEVIGSCLNFM